MLRRLPADLIALKPNVVVWKAGTAEASAPPRGRALPEHLQSGIERVIRSGADVMLVTPQYSRETARLVTYQPYIDAMNSIGMRRDVLMSHASK